MFTHVIMQGTGAGGMGGGQAATGGQGMTGGQTGGMGGGRGGGQGGGMGGGMGGGQGGGMGGGMGGGGGQQGGMTGKLEGVSFCCPTHTPSAHRMDALGRPKMTLRRMTRVPCHERQQPAGWHDGKLKGVSSFDLTFHLEVHGICFLCCQELW